MPKLTMIMLPLVGGEQDGEVVSVPQEIEVPCVLLPGGAYTRRSLGNIVAYVIEGMSDKQAATVF